MTENPDISIIVPVYGSDATLMPLYERIAAAASRIPASFELIFVDDCGPGNPWDIIVRLSQKDPRVRGLKLSKNFGQHIAITAGVDAARGNRLVIMDCDLQDRPEEIPRLWAKAQEGHDIVIGRRVNRQDGFLKRLLSGAFHFIFRHMTDQQSDAAQSNFGIYSSRVVSAVKTLSGHPGIFPLLCRQAGFDIATIEVEHGKRVEGKSSYTFGRKLSLAMDIIALYSSRSLKLFIHILFAAVLAVFCYVTWKLAGCFFVDQTPACWNGDTASLFLLLGSLFCILSILGTYLYRVYHQADGKSLYFVNIRTRAVRDDGS